MKYSNVPRVTFWRAIMACAFGTMLSCTNQGGTLGDCEVSYIQIDTSSRLTLITGCRQDLQALSREDLRRIEVTFSGLKAQNAESHIDDVLRGGQGKLKSVCTFSQGGLKVVPANSRAYCLEVQGQTASAVLVGPREDIQSISNAELRKIGVALDTILREERFEIFEKSRHPSFRSTVTGRLNGILERRAIGDVYWEGGSISEPTP